MIAAQADLKCIKGDTKETCKEPCLYDPGTQAICYSPDSFYNNKNCAPGVKAARCAVPIALATQCAAAASEAACSAVGHCAFANGTCSVDQANQVALLPAMIKAAKAVGTVLLPVVYEATAICASFNTTASCTLASYNYTIAAANSTANATASPASPLPTAGKDAPAPTPSPAPSPRPNGAAAPSGSWHALAAAGLLCALAALF